VTEPPARHPQTLFAQASDGHRWELLLQAPAQPRAVLLWLPALGVAARHYLPLAQALADRGIATAIHEWRGNGSSSLRAGRDCDWGYRELLTLDLPASEALLDARFAGVPRVVGGHSLGGQLACCRLALAPASAAALWLVASGSAFWRVFPGPERWWRPAAYRVLDWLARRHGALPGRRIGFGGQEARGVVGDWSRSALTGRYAAAGLAVDLEQAMQSVDAEVSAVTFARDWLAPSTSLQYLLSKLGATPAAIHCLDDAALGVRADHFAWMKQPAAVADRLAGGAP